MTLFWRMVCQAQWLVLVFGSANGFWELATDSGRDALGWFGVAAWTVSRWKSAAWYSEEGPLDG